MYKFIILLAISAIVITACSDDFVEVDSFDENSEDFFNTEQDYQDALVGAYDLLQASYINVMLGEIASDNTLSGGASAVDVPGIEQIDNMTHSPINSNLRDVWNWMFAGVNRANFVLEFKDKIDFDGKDQVIAQATFLRAYYYFELVKFFGDVPLAVDQRLLFGDQSEIERTPASDVYAQIEEDLRFASDNLPLTQIQTGRVTKGAAQALLGKVLLYQGKYNAAALALDEVINYGIYDLVEDPYEVFPNEFQNNIESVFEIQYSDLEGAGFGCLQCSEGNVAVGFNGIRNFNGPLFESGFSFNVPTEEMYNAYSDNDVRRDAYILNIVAFAEANSDYNDGAGVTYDEGYKHTGYFNRKYLPRKGDSNIGDQNLTNPNNYRAIRYADVLLMAAEAHNKSNPPNDGQARVYLNEVRERANLTPTSASGSDLTQGIYQDRRLEMVGEGHRFFDLVRTGRAATEIDGFTSGKNELFPIPSIEIQLAGNRWPQNPGY